LEFGAWDLEFPPKEGDVALVLHTSGTTSRPKLVPLTHANLCASAHHIGLTLGLNPNDRCLNVMPLFHIHGLVGAVLSTLAAGGSVVCTPGFYAPKFFEWMNEFRPTWYTAVPTMHQAVLARAAHNRDIIARCPLRFIRSSSSALPPQVMRELESEFGAPVIESYGMTEASHQMTSNPLPPHERKAGSVGVAAGPEVAIMDEAGHLLPRGETGEIVIRGGNVTRGYENNPAANEQAFTDGWFRTGDQGVFDADGYLFITGRLKEIINRGGEKISPREVDEALMDHPAVAQAVTFAIPHTKLGEEVGAAVVLRPAASTTERELRRFAATRLADFKTPRRVLIVDDIPKGATGKLQRIGLAESLGLTALDDESSHEKADYVAPRTPVEQALAEIWGQVLGVERVGIHDHFFQLGGDSLLATQILSQVREVLLAELSFLNLMDAPTVAGMALAVAQSQIERTASSHELTMAPRANRHAAPLSYAQQRLWFLQQLEPGSTAYNRPAHLRLTGPLDVNVLEQSLNEMVRRHEILRTTFAVQAGQPVQVISPAQPLTVPVVDLCDLPESEQEAQIRRLHREQTRQPFDLTRGPVFRSTLLRLGPKDHVLLLTLHHIVFDGWSMGVLIRELAALYEAFSARQPSPLPRLPIQYADYAHWQRQWLQGDVPETHLSYWKQQLADAPVLKLPTDRPRPAVRTFQGARHSFALGSDLTEELKALARQEGVTLFMMLLGAFSTLLYGYTGQEDISVGTFVVNRNRAEVEGLIGFFVNNLVLRADLSGDPSFRELLGRVRQVTLGAYAHQELPFEKLLEELQPRRDPGRTPLFQVMLALHNTPSPVVEAAGLVVREHLMVESTRSNFDLTLWLSEGPEGLWGFLEYSTDLFEAVTIARMLENFQILLGGIVANPDQRLSRLPLSTDAARSRPFVEVQVQASPETMGDISLRRDRLLERQDQLSAAKRALLEKRLRGEVKVIRQ
jgi:non-ribosomal peptide synthetase component F